MSSDDQNLDYLDSVRLLAARARFALRDKVIWMPGVPKLHIILKAALARQVESLEAALLLAGSNQGHAALPFVRPACEEYLWLTYLAHIQQEDAEQLIDHLSREQALDVLRAQEAFVGKEETTRLGLGGTLERFSKEVVAESTSRRLLGERLGWDRRTIERSKLPSTRYVAKQIDELLTYDFIFGASSRHVHFSVGELWRRVWGKGVVYNVGSLSYGKYFTAFALCWTSHFLVRTFVTAQPLLPGSFSRFACDDTWLTRFPRGLMAIVTSEEFRAPPTAGTHAA